MEWPATYRRKVRYSDTDSQGIVFNGNYATYIDDTITDYFEAMEIPGDELARRGYEMVLARSEIDYRSAARLGEVLVTGARVARVGTSSVNFELQTWEEGSRRVVIDARLVYVVVDHESFRPTTAPDFFLDGIERLQRAPVAR